MGNWLLEFFWTTFREKSEVTKQKLRNKNEEKVEKKIILLTFVCEITSFRVEPERGITKPRLERIKVKIRKKIPSSAIILFN